MQFLKHNAAKPLRFKLALLLLLPDPFLRMGVWQQTINSQESAISLCLDRRLCKEIELLKRLRRKLLSRTGQDEVRSVLSLVTSGIARRIFDSGEMSIQRKAECVVAKAREDVASIATKHVLPSKSNPTSLHFYSDLLRRFLLQISSEKL